MLLNFIVLPDYYGLVDLFFCDSLSFLKVLILKRSKASLK